MRVLVIAQGNPLRRDDGAAHAVLERLSPARDVESRSVMQLTPEMAEDLAAFDPVIFIDADVRASKLSIEALDGPQLDASPSPSALTHAASPAEIVQLSRMLFGFVGRAFLCRIPVDDLSSGEGLSRRVIAFAVQAAARLETFLSELRAEFVSRTS